MASTGQRFGPYRCVRKLGSGGMAETWLAVQRGDAGFEQRVCLKLVHEHLRGSDEFLKLFEREAAIAASLRHSNIIGVIDANPDDGYMALELVDGTDLRTLLEHAPRGRLPPHLVIYLAIELAKALYYAHGRARGGDVDGIVHRDISPANVLVSYCGEIKLADFGIAKTIRATGDVDSALRGNLAYMSPEQLCGTVIDARSDLFALGVVLYEAAAGHNPFAGASDAETWDRIANGRRPPIAALVPELPAALRRVIETALALDRAQRFDSAAEVVRWLARETPAPTVYRELGKLARSAKPHQTLTLDLPHLLEASELEASGPRSELPTRTLKRPAPARTSPAPRLLLASEAAALAGSTRRHDSRSAALPTPRPRGRAAAIGTALATALVPIGLWVSRQPPHARGGTGAEGAKIGTTTASQEGPAAGDTRSAAPVVQAPSPELPVAEPAASADSAGSAAAAPARPAPVRVPEPVPGPRSRPSKVASPSRPPRPAPSRREAPRREAAPATASIHVGVFPAGLIWVDGTPRGRAPLTLELPLGKHVIAAGQVTPETSRELDVGLGEAEPVIFHLRAPALGSAR